MTRRYPLCWTCPGNPCAGSRQVGTERFRIFARAADFLTQRLLRLDLHPADRFGNGSLCLRSHACDLARERLTRFFLRRGACLRDRCFARCIRIRLQSGELLPKAGTDWLLKLLPRVKTGPHRLKGLLPPDTIVAHKTGTTDVVSNDVGIITLPRDSAIGGHLVLAVFVTNGRPSAKTPS